MINPNNLLFASLELPDIDKQTLAKEILQVSIDKWIFDDYRNTYLLPIRTMSGGGARLDLEISDIAPEVSAYQWTEECPQAIKNYFEKNVFNWIDKNARVVILRTPAKTSNTIHIDCLSHQLQCFPLKFRYVIQGRTDSLYYLTDAGKVFIPQTEKPFLMDGTWAHGMNNLESYDKITICLGAPWAGSNKYPAFANFLLKNSFRRSHGWEKYFDLGKGKISE